MSERPKSPEDFMRRAIELAARGYPAPNPRVGCVLVREGEIAGEGWHEAKGLAHAERMARDSAGSLAKGSTAYVTLEPCAHFGLQPPCADALISAGVTAVVYAIHDPNPKAQGGGQRLREEGISVSTGLLADEAFTANAAWLTAVRRGRPYVTVKVAMSLDGRIALPNGQSKWITGSEARAVGRQLRAEMGCVVVGAGTYRKDNPELTARIEGLVNEPLRVVWDPFEKLTQSPSPQGGEGTGVNGECEEAGSSEPPRPSGERGQGVRGEDFAQDGAFRTTPVGEVEGEGVSESLSPGATPTPAPSPSGDGEGVLISQAKSPHDLLTQLWSQGQTSILVEGGAWTISRFLEANLVDKIELFVAPKILGEGLTWANLQIENPLERNPDWRIEKTQLRGNDIQVSLISETSRV